MYDDTVTLFNRRENQGEILWYPTTLAGVYLSAGQAALEAGLGTMAGDRALLLVPCQGSGVLGGKTYLEPAAWRRTDEPGGFLTFSAGAGFDFFITGLWEGSEPVPDRDYPGGLYQYLDRARDGVYAITAVARYQVIPHFEITGR